MLQITKTQKVYALASTISSSPEKLKGSQQNIKINKNPQTLSQLKISPVKCSPTKKNTSKFIPLKCASEIKSLLQDKQRKLRTSHTQHSESSAKSKKSEIIYFKQYNPIVFWDNTKPTRIGFQDSYGSCLTRPIFPQQQSPTKLDIMPLKIKQEKVLVKAPSRDKTIQKERPIYYLPKNIMHRGAMSDVNSLSRQVYNKRKSIEMGQRGQRGSVNSSQMCMSQQFIM